MSARVIPDKPGWWWVRSGRDEAVDGWCPVLVYSPSFSDALGFDQPCRGGWVGVREYAWLGPCDPHRAHTRPERTPCATMPVRILVRADVVDGDRAYYSALGWGNHLGTAKEDRLRSHLEEMQDPHDTDSPRYSWVTAHVPLPAPPDEVDGTVEP